MTLANFHAWRAARALDADLYHLHDPELIPLGLRLAANGKKVIWDAHEDYRTQFSAASRTWIPRQFTPIVSSSMNALLTRIDRSAAAIIAATSTIAETYANRNTVVVSNQARVSDFQECLPQFGNRSLLFTGSITSARLFQEVVEATASIPDLTLRVAGREPTGQMWDNGQELLGDRLQYIGWLDRAGLAEAISSSSIGIASYSDIDVHAKSRSSKIFEFAAAGLPIVTTPNELNAKTCQEGGLGIVARGFGAEDIREAILPLLDDPELWTATSTTARVWGHSAGSWEGDEQVLLNLYKQLLDI